MFKNAVPRLISLAALLSLLTILFGFGLGAVFGAAESSIKKHLDDQATKVMDTAYKGDLKLKEKVVGKSWDYFKRAHLHGGAIGTAALAAICLLILLCRLDLLAQLSALSFGLGGLIYSLFWLFAGLYAPALGSTGAAKEAFSFLALPGAVLSLAGLVGVMICLIRDAFGAREI